MTIFSLQDGVSPGLPVALTHRYTQASAFHSTQKQDHFSAKSISFRKIPLWNCYTQVNVLKKQWKTQCESCGTTVSSIQNHTPWGQGETQWHFGFFFFNFLILLIFQNLVVALSSIRSLLCSPLPSTYKAVIVNTFQEEPIFHSSL